MDYQALIDETRKKIDNYTFDDSTYNAIYDKAKAHLESSYKAGAENIQASLNDARQKAVGDNAVATKSLQEALTLRGLARSGESAMLRINQQLSLSNALAKLSGQATHDKNELFSEHKKQLADLDIELGKQKNTAIESEKNALYNRLDELEKLKADDEKWKAELYASNAQASTGKNPTSTNGSEKGEENESKFDPNLAYQGFLRGLTSNNTEGVTPDYAPEKIVENLLILCGVDDGIIRSNTMQSKIYKELARLIVSSDYSKEYSMELVSILRSHGFSVEFDIGLLRSKNMQRAYQQYQLHYRDYYSSLVRSGFNTNEAAFRAREYAKSRTVAFLDSLDIEERQYNKIIDMLWMLKD